MLQYPRNSTRLSQCGRVFVSLFFAAVLFGCNESEQTTPSKRSTSMAVWNNNDVAGTFEQQVHVFKGIPFAEPPIDQLRWREPQYLPNPGSIEALEYAPACIQNDGNSEWYQTIADALGHNDTVIQTPAVSEDCLYLNVFTPDVVSSANLPVMVWIHGGSNKNGWSYEPNYLAHRLAQQGVVVVTIAYRLGVFGFFAHPELNHQDFATNFGILDQQAALQWVQDNIHAFGGSPSNVTVFGESAGGADIGYLVASPLSEGLFHKTIRQSAGFELLNRADRSAYESELASLGQVDDLRSLSSTALFERVNTELPDFYYTVTSDEASFPSSVAIQIAEGTLPHYPTIIGTNADEWLMYLPETVHWSDVDEALELRGINLEAAQSILSSIPAKALDQIETAEQMLCPSIEFARYNAQSSPTYVYQFDKIRDGLEGSLGAYHGAEIPYVFNTHDDWLTTTQQDRDLTMTMQQYWLNFAKVGNPNADNLPEWTNFSADAEHRIRLGSTITLEVFDDQLCELLATNDVND